MFADQMVEKLLISLSVDLIVKTHGLIYQTVAVIVGLECGLLLSYSAHGFQPHCLAVMKKNHIVLPGWRVLWRMPVHRGDGFIFRMGVSHNSVPTGSPQFSSNFRNTTFQLPKSKFSKNQKQRRLFLFLKIFNIKN